jgi:hypothetical protein
MDCVHVLLPLGLAQSVETLIECTAMGVITEDPASGDSITNSFCVNIELACIVTFSAACEETNAEEGEIYRTRLCKKQLHGTRVSFLRKLGAQRLQFPEWQNGTGRVGILHGAVTIYNRGGQTENCCLDKTRGATVKFRV